MSDPVVSKEEPKKNNINEDAFAFDILNSPAKPQTTHKNNIQQINNL